MKFEIIKDNESLEEFAERMEEPKQETLEEAATKLLWKKYPYHPPLDSGYWQDMFIEGAKWQMERSYSEKEVLNMLIKFVDERTFLRKEVAKIWFKQFKKK